MRKKPNFPRRSTAHEENFYRSTTNADARDLFAVANLIVVTLPKVERYQLIGKTGKFLRMSRTLESGLDWPLCHCAVAQAPPFDEHRRPLAPSKFFDK